MALCSSLDTSGAAHLYTRQRTGLGWLGREPRQSHSIWGTATTCNAITPGHIDAFATMGMVLSGKKLWSVADEGTNVPGSSTPGRMDTIHAFDNWDSLSAPAANRGMETVLLEEGDIM